MGDNPAPRAGDGARKWSLRTSRECNVKAKAKAKVTCAPFEVAELKAAQVASEAREIQSLQLFRQLLRFTQPRLNLLSLG